MVGVLIQTSKVDKMRDATMSIMAWCPCSLPNVHYAYCVQRVNALIRLMHMVVVARRLETAHRRFLAPCDGVTSSPGVFLFNNYTRAKFSTASHSHNSQRGTLA
jgi:hypothetical protein